MKHTPKPWLRDVTYIYSDIADTAIHDTPDNPCAPHESEAIANAEFIVRAVNSHSDLLEACEAHKKMFITEWGQDMWIATYREMDAAINKAKGD